MGQSKLQSSPDLDVLEGYRQRLLEEVAAVDTEIAILRQPVYRATVRAERPLAGVRI